MILLDARDRASEIARAARGKKREMLFSGYVPAQGMGSIQAGSKAGKTWLTMQFAYAAAGYCAMPGMQTAAEPRTVLYIDGELDNLGFGHRTVDMLKPEDGDRVIRIDRERWLPNGMSLFDHGTNEPNHKALQNLMETIIKHDIKVLLIDPWYLIAGDENNNERVATLMSALRRVQRETGILVVIVHHYGKEEPTAVSDPFQLGRGASSFGGFLDWVLCLARGKEGQFILHHGYRYGPANEPIAVRFSREKYRWGVDDKPIVTLEMQVDEFFAKRGETGLKDFCEEASKALKVSAKAIRDTLQSSERFDLPTPGAGKAAMVRRRLAS